MASENEELPLAVRLMVYLCNDPMIVLLKNKRAIYTRVASTSRTRGFILPRSRLLFSVVYDICSPFEQHQLSWLSYPTLNQPTLDFSAPPSAGKQASTAGAWPVTIEYKILDIPYVNPTTTPASLTKAIGADWVWWTTRQKSYWEVKKQ
jgi:hypothetical protein